MGEVCVCFECHVMGVFMDIYIYMCVLMCAFLFLKLNLDVCPVGQGKRFAKAGSGEGCHYFGANLPLGKGPNIDTRMATCTVTKTRQYKQQQNTRMHRERCIHEHPVSVYGSCIWTSGVLLFIFTTV